VLFSGVWTVDYVGISWRSAARWRQTREVGKQAIFELNESISFARSDGADGCCITSNKSLTCLQLIVLTSNWSNFRHAFASRGFVSVSWAFLLFQAPAPPDFLARDVHNDQRAILSPVTRMYHPKTHEVNITFSPFSPSL